MNNKQKLVYEKLKEAVALANAQEPLGVHEIVEPIIRYLVTLLALYEGYSSLDADALKKLEQEYYENPQYNIVTLLQCINILDITENVTKKEDKNERTISDL